MHMHAGLLACTLACHEEYHQLLNQNMMGLNCLFLCLGERGCMHVVVKTSYYEFIITLHAMQSMCIMRTCKWVMMHDVTLVPKNI